jgi:hypothetical protein
MKEQDWQQFKDFTKTFFLWVNSNPDLQKFTFKLDNPEYHYTLRIWKDKREVDFHQTNETLAKGHPDKYKTYFRIKYFSLGRIVVALKQLDYEGLMKMIISSKINLGKLNKYHCILIPLDKDDPTYKEFYNEKIKKSSTKVKLNPDFDFLKPFSVITPDDGLDHPARCFVVYKVKNGSLKKNGFVYRFPVGKLHGPNSFVYFSRKVYKEFKGSIGLLLYNILGKIEFHNKEKVMSFIDGNVLKNLKVMKKNINQLQEN